ncbi:hypothetical protein OROMI_013960 [Orobanche minor]
MNLDWFWKLRLLPRLSHSASSTGPLATFSTTLLPISSSHLHSDFLGKTRAA